MAGICRNEEKSYEEMMLRSKFWKSNMVEGEIYRSVSLQHHPV